MPCSECASASVGINSSKQKNALRSIGFILELSDEIRDSHDSARLGVYCWASYPVVVYPSTTQDHGMAKPSPLFDGDPVLVALGGAVRRARVEMRVSQEALAVDAD